MSEGTSSKTLLITSLPFYSSSRVSNFQYRSTCSVVLVSNKLNREKRHIKTIHDGSIGSMSFVHFHQMQAPCMQTSLRYHLMSDLEKTKMILVRYSF